MRDRFRDMVNAIDVKKTEKPIYKGAIILVLYCAPEMAVAIRVGNRPPGTPGGIGGEAAEAAVLTSAGELAHMLCQDRERIGESLGEWLSAPLLPRTEAASLPMAKSWKERERDRQLRRSQERVHKEKFRMQDLQKAATAAIGKRTSRPPSVAADFAETGAIGRIAEVLRSLLLDPIRLTIHAAPSGALSMHPFGLGRCRQFAIRAFSPAELTILQYLAMSAETWVHPESCECTAFGETLVAGPDANDAFEVALDRLALVSIVCEHVSRLSEWRHCVRQGLECAVLMTASMPDVMGAGYYDGLVGLAMAIRCDLPREQSQTWAAKQQTMQDAAYVALHNVHFTDGNEFFRRVRDEAEWRPLPERPVQQDSVSRE